MESLVSLARTGFFEEPHDSPLFARRDVIKAARNRSRRRIWSRAIHAEALAAGVVMCTVTWLRTADGYTLLCNRDERTTRLPAHGPQINERRGVRYVAPVDGDHGGSWIGVNEFGLSLCLLNRYGDLRIEAAKDYVSRGLLLIDLLDCHRTDSLKLRLNDFDLARFRPFILLGVGKESASTLFQWNGVQLSVIPDAEGLVPLTSSSAREPGIATERTKQFELLRTDELTESKLVEFHRSHLPQRGAYSVCMHREGASTVSLSQVRVSNGEIEFSYEAGAPCKSVGVEKVGLK